MTTEPLDVAFFQFNAGLYGKQSYLPYSAGMLWSYARSIPEVAAAFGEPEFYCVREDPEAIVESLGHVDVAAFSTYLWNWEISHAVAKGIKRRFPAALVVFGGPHIPNDARPFLEAHRHVDLAVHGEGELTFADILRARATGGDYEGISGMSYLDGSGAFHCKEVVRAPIMNLDDIPSPFLTGVFDRLLERPIQFQATWETNRGCPYKCTFCYWGTGYEFVQKLRQFSVERLMAEIDWFGERRMHHIFLADANFGILPRDVELSKYLADVKARTGGYPAKFKANYAKNNTDRVQTIARILNREGLDRGIGLAVQSMDDVTLKNIKRKNIKIESFSHFMHEYQKEGIPTYVELILGMPGETLASFKEGLDRLLVAGAHDAVFLHKCIVLPNTPMAEPEYRSAFGIVTRAVPATLPHRSTDERDVREFEDLVIATSSMPTSDWKAAFLFAWILQTGHILRLTQALAVYAYSAQGTSFTDFYEALLEFADANPETVIGRELRTTRDLVDRALEGHGFDVVLPEFPEIYWPPEEASFLRICLEASRFFAEIGRFLSTLASRRGWSADAGLLRDLVAYQEAIVVKWDRDGSTDLELGRSIHSFYRAALEGRATPLARGRYHVSVRDDLHYRGDLERFSREIPFWGRRGGKMNYAQVREGARE